MFACKHTTSSAFGWLHNIYLLYLVLQPMTVVSVSRFTDNCIASFKCEWVCISSYDIRTFSFKLAFAAWSLCLNLLVFLSNLNIEGFGTIMRRSVFRIITGGMPYVQEGESLSVFDGIQLTGNSLVSTLAIRFRYWWILVLLLLYQGLVYEENLFSWLYCVHCYCLFDMRLLGFLLIVNLCILQ